MSPPPSPRYASAMFIQTVRPNRGTTGTTGLLLIRHVDRAAIARNYFFVTTKKVDPLPKKIECDFNYLLSTQFVFLR